MNLLFISGFFTLNSKLKLLIDFLIIDDETIPIRFTNIDLPNVNSIEGKI